MNDGESLPKSAMVSIDLRAHIACQVMAGMCGCQDFINECCKVVQSRDEARHFIANQAVEYADALIERLQRPPEFLKL